MKTKTPKARVMRAGSDYGAQLAAWKSKVGYREPLDGEDDEEQTRCAADRKLPGEDYCVICGEGPQTISGMCLITRRTDPYLQCDHEKAEDEDAPDNRSRACPRCFKENYVDEDESPEPPNAVVSRTGANTEA